MIRELTSVNFQEIVLDSPVPVVVDFWAEWCGPCKVLKPVLSVIAEEYGSRVQVCTLDVDNFPEVAQQYGVQSIPFVAKFENGKITKHIVGAMPKKQLKAALELPQP